MGGFVIEPQKVEPMGVEPYQEEPNVVSETQLQDLVQRGFHVEVVAAIDATKVSSVWFGLWFARVVSEDRSVEKLLTTARTVNGVGFERREFKTANGLVSFLHRAGFKTSSVPLYAGGRETHVLVK